MSRQCGVVSEAKGFYKRQDLREEKKDVEIDVVGRKPTADVSSARRGANLNMCVDRGKEGFSAVSINNGGVTCGM